MGEIRKIGFWGYPEPLKIKGIKEKYPHAEWIDLDIDFNAPKTNILPESYCKIIRNIIDNTINLEPDLILAPIGKDKCDSGWFASKVLSDLGFNVVQTIFEDLEPKKEIKICKSDLSLYDKVCLITDNIIYPKQTELSICQPQFGFWGVPPNDLEILKLFPNTTHVYGWLRCVEAGTPADIDLEMYVDKNIPTVFYAQAFCSKTQIAKYLADKYNGLYVDIDDYATTSVKAKIEAFLKLR